MNQATDSGDDRAPFYGFVGAEPAIELAPGTGSVPSAEMVSPDLPPKFPDAAKYEP
jgi:hypothetical protein